MCLPSVPQLIRLRLSFKRILSILYSSADMSGLIVIPDYKELHTSIASKALRNVTMIGRGHVFC